MSDCTEAIQLDHELAPAYFKRGNVYVVKGDDDRALTDYNEAIHLDPTLDTAYFDRGILYDRKADYDHAIADFDQVIQRRPNVMVAYYERGLANLYAGLSPNAIADFAKATALAPKYPYAALWLEIADRRGRVPDRLAAAAKLIDMTKWPAPVIRLYLGQLTSEAALAAADDPNPTIKNGQVCEANVFIGELALQQGQKNEAKRLFQLAAKGCPKTFVEWWTANAELKTLSATQ